MMSQYLDSLAEMPAGSERLLPWFGVVAGALVLIYVAIVVIRRLSRQINSQTPPASGFSIDCGGQMFRAGEISEAEFKPQRSTAWGLVEVDSTKDNASSSGGGVLDDEE